MEDGCPPFFIGLNGIRRAGKTTLVSTTHIYLTGQLDRIYLLTYNREVLSGRIDDLVVDDLR
jgi:predicted AAA+ superfamily ATPase